jgi:hypothetical protein
MHTESVKLELSPERERCRQKTRFVNLFVVVNGGVLRTKVF